MIKNKSAFQTLSPIAHEILRSQSEEIKNSLISRQLFSNVLKFFEDFSINLNKRI